MRQPYSGLRPSASACSQQRPAGVLGGLGAAGEGDLAGDLDVVGDDGRRRVELFGLELSVDPLVRPQCTDLFHQPGGTADVGRRGPPARNVLLQLLLGEVTLQRALLLSGHLQQPHEGIFGGEGGEFSGVGHVLGAT